MTTYASYGFTKADPAAALAAAERLAEGHGHEAARRLHDDGSIDVALMEERDFHLYLIDAQGVTTLIESRPPPLGRRNWKGLMWLGLALLPIAFAAAAIRYPDGIAPAVGIFGAALVAAIVGGLAAGKYDLRWHLSKQFTDPEEWRRFREPSRWSPRSLAQLRAAEGLAYYHDGKAMIRELPDGAAEVVTLESGRLLRHRVDERGALTELTGAGRTPLYVVGVSMTNVGAVAAFGLFALMRSVTGSVGAILGGLVGMSLIPLGATLIHMDGVERRIRRSEPGTWYLLRTNREPRED